MKKIKIQSYQYILDENEAKLVRECLGYCHHCFNTHPPHYELRQFVDDKKVEQLAREFFNEVERLNEVKKSDKRYI